MGLSIHYSGRIADKNTLPQLIEEVEEIATVHGWKCKIYEREFPIAVNQWVTPSHPLIDSPPTSESATSSGALTKKNEKQDGKLYGIEFTPEGSEPISLCFLSNGRMSGIMQLSSWGEFKGNKKLVLNNGKVNKQGEIEIHSKEVTITADDYARYLYMCSSKTQYAGPQAHEMIIGLFRYIEKTYLADFRMVDEAEFWETGDKELLETQFARNKLLIDSFGSIANVEKRFPEEDIESYILRIIAEMRKR